MLFAAVNSLASGCALAVVRTWDVIRRIMYPVVEPPLRPLTRRLDEWEDRRNLRHRAGDLALADRLDAAGHRGPAETLRGMYR